MKVNQILQGDCLEIMPNIPDKSIDMILCDLPYGTTACKWDTIIPFEPLWKQYKRIIKDNGAIVLTASQPFTSILIMSNLKMFKYEWIWNKGRGVGHLLAKKRPMMCTENVIIFYEDLTQRKQKLLSFVELRKYFYELICFIGDKKQIIKKIGQKADHCFRYNSTQWDLPTKETYQELINIFNINLFPQFKSYNILREKYMLEERNLGDVIYNPQMRKRDKPRLSKMKQTNNTCYGDLKDYKGKELTEKYPINLILFNKSSHKDMLLHPTQKPVALFEYLIKTYTNKGDLVLDNCAGSGTTGVACKNLGRKYILIEKEEKYIEIIQKRINAIPETLFDIAK